MSKRRCFHIYDQRIREVKTSYQLGYGKSRHNLLTAMLSEETAIQQMMHGVNMFPLELFPAKTLNCVYQELDILQSFLEM